MICYGSRDGDCVRSKAALLICCWPQSQALHSTSRGCSFKRGIWEQKGRKPHTSTEKSHIKAHKGTPGTSIPRCDVESNTAWACRDLVHVPMNCNKAAGHLSDYNSPVTAVTDTMALCNFPIRANVCHAISRFNKKNLSLIDNPQYYRNTHGAVNYFDCVLTESSAVLS